MNALLNPGMLLGLFLYGLLLPVCARAAQPPTDSLQLVQQLQEAADQAENDPEAAIEVIRGVIAKAETRGYPRLQAEAHQMLGQQYKIQYELSRSRAHLLAAVQLLATLPPSRPDTLLLARTCNMLSITYFMEERYDSGLVYNRNAIDLYRAAGDTANYQMALNNLAQVYQIQGKFERALEIYQRSLKHNTRHNRPYYATLDLLSIASIFYRMDLYTRHFETLQRAEKYAKAADNLRLLADVYGRMATNQQDLDRIAAAFQYAYKAKACARAANDNYELQSIYQRLGMLHRAGNHLDSARYYARRSIALNDGQSRRELAYNYQLLGDIATREDQARTAINNYLTALHFAVESMQPGTQRDICYNLLEAYQLLPNPDSALHYGLRYVHLRDSILEYEEVEETSRLQTKYDFYRKRDQQARYASAVAARRQTRNQQQYFLIFGGLLLLGTVLLVFARLGIPRGVLTAASFFAALLFFEALLVYLDPFIENYSEGYLLPKLGLNLVLAVFFAFGHRWLERRLHT